jgi:DNA polymerase-3 subunit beta
MPITAAQIGKHVLEADELTRSLIAVAAAVRETTSPATACVRLHDGVLTATDGEIVVELEVAGADGIDQPLLLPHARLLAMSKTCRGGTVTLTPRGTACTVASKGVRWTLPLLDADSFPAPQQEPLLPLPRLPVDQFRDRIESVRGSATKDSGRFALSGVLIDVSDETVTFVASDGRRMSWAECDHGQSIDPKEILISARAAALLSRIATLQDNETGVQMEFSSKRFVATFDKAVVSAVLLSGDFPRWRKVVPKRDDIAPAIVERSELAAATRSASIVHSPTSAGVTFTLGDQHGELRCSSSEYGSSQVRMALVDAGNKSCFSIRPDYVTDWLENLPGTEEPNVEIEAEDGENPVVFRCGDYRCLIAPIAQDA